MVVDDKVNVEEMDESIDLFAEPEGYYPPSPKPTTEQHSFLSGRTVTVSLVGQNPLWGHHLWNAGRIISHYLEKQPALIQNKTVLELGAGAGLPSLVCSILGAKQVVVSDYPDPDLVQNLWKNIDAIKQDSKIDGNVVAEGYCWGADTTALSSHITEPGFDILILADLLFNHSEHEKLVSTIELTLKKGPESKALVFFTPYRPWLYDKDMAFFETCKERGFVVDKVLEEKMEKVMFEADPGDEELRRTVFGYVITWPSS